MTSAESLVDHEFLFAFNEPDEFAANPGEPPRRCRGLRVSHPQQGPPLLWVKLALPVSVQGTPTDEIALQARHVEMSLEDLLKGYDLMANAYVPSGDEGYHFFATMKIWSSKAFHRR